MSGGSFNHLYKKEVDELFESKTDLYGMLEALEDLGYAEDAAAETDEILSIIRLTRIRIQRRINRLKDVWHAMEWWRSGDSSEDDFKRVLAKYREEHLDENIN